jgi:hypothetical protein
MIQIGWVLDLVQDLKDKTQENKFLVELVQEMDIMDTMGG